MSNPIHFKPCKIGYKVKVYLSTDYYECEHTFGIVIGLTRNNKPILSYSDLSNSKLRDFNRALLKKDIVFDGEYKSHYAWNTEKMKKEFCIDAFID